ncbi:hypothetical protein [Vineibacter terrae]|uniref:hypothetical protein n=1 Tax=Vineibacter terrae TaxID=2586908 RepID=UPI002E337A37|nr:hypothetical protein [Vineibacter terrae]HEX2887877.1 hypothetical protein [Vineibacter terrae]
MRQPIETVPKDGKFVILDDGVNYDVARWVAERRIWIDENGEPCKLSATHWLPYSQWLYGLHAHAGRASDEAAAERTRLHDFLLSSSRATPQRLTLLSTPPPAVANRSLAAIAATTAKAVREGTTQAGRRLAVPVIAVGSLAAGVAGTYFYAEVTGYVGAHTRSSADASDATPGRMIPARDAEELRQSLLREHERAEALARDLAAARREMEAQAAQSSKAGDAAVLERQAGERAAAELRQSLQQEHDRAEALARDLAAARREIQAQAAQSSKAGDAAILERQAGERAAAEMRQSLQQEHDRAEALARDLAAARREVQAQAAQSSKAGDDATQSRQAAERTAAELRQALQQARDRSEVLAGDLAAAREEIHTLSVKAKEGGEAAQAKLAAAERGIAEARQGMQAERDRAEALSRDLAAARRELQTQVALVAKANDDAAQVKRTIAGIAADLREGLQQERARAEALSRELVLARGEMEAQAAQSGGTAAHAMLAAAERAAAEMRQSLQEARGRAEALARELAQARDQMAAQAAQSSTTGDAAERAAAEARQGMKQARDGAEALAQELALVRGEMVAQAALSSKAGDTAARSVQEAQQAEAEARQGLQQARDRAEALARDLETARRESEAYAARVASAGDEARQLRQAAAGATAALQQALTQEREHAAALARDLAAARQDLQAQAAQSSKAGDEATQARQAAERVAAELRVAMQQQRDRAEALSHELAMARGEIEAQVALSGTAGGEAVQARQAAEREAAATQQALRQERKRAAALAQELEAARQAISTQAARERDIAAQVDLMRKAAEAAAAEYRQALAQERERHRMQQTPVPPQPDARGGADAIRSVAVGPADVTGGSRPAPVDARPAGAPSAPDSPDVGRLMVRASGLLSQGDIGSARAMLERAAEMGSVRAAFALAETYDPLILSTWRTYGTRGDAAKAREFYAKAQAGGVAEATVRLEALRREP